MKSYDVALWRYWPSLFPEWTEQVKAFSEYQAIYALMRVHGLRFVEKAAVVEVEAIERLRPDGTVIQCWCNVVPTKRYYYVFCPKQLEEVIADD